jgi:hypothetical protein
MEISSVRPLLPDANAGQAQAILGAMRAVAETGRGWTTADGKALIAAARFMFGQDGSLDAEALVPVPPERLALVIAEPHLREQAVMALAVMAVMDAPLDTAKFELVVRYAGQLGIHRRYLDEMAETARHQLQEALADMTRANMDSILNRPWPGGDVNAWLLPYQGSKADPDLVTRFEALEKLPQDSFGREFWRHFKDNNYAFPGDPRALNAVFAVPHDSVHVLTGYDTQARGEILTSTFTAAMHRNNPMAGHILPAIFTWHLKVQINAVTGNFEGALDPSEVWRAWAAGTQSPADAFATGWNFWDQVGQAIDVTRASFSIPPGGLDASSAKSRR